MPRKKKPTSPTTNTDDKDSWTESCISCGRPIQVKNKLRCRHECPKSHEAALRSADTRLRDAMVRKPTLQERLADGFKMLNEDDNDD